MQTAEDAKKMLKGGEWMIKDSLPEDIFTPEDFNEEQRMVMEMCTSFLDTEIFPIVAQIDTLEPGLMPGWECVLMLSVKVRVRERARIRAG